MCNMTCDDSDIIQVGDLILYSYRTNSKSKILIRYIISENEFEFNTLVLDLETRDRYTGAKFFGRTTTIKKKEAHYYEVL